MTCLGRNEDDSDNPNPCRGLDEEACGEEDGCDMRQDRCVWTAAPENSRTIYVIYEWEYLYEEGDKTPESYCFSDEDSTEESTEESTEVSEESTEESAEVSESTESEDSSSTGETPPLEFSELTNVEEYAAFCLSMNSEDCKFVGCALDKDDSCGVAKKNKFKCNKLGDKDRAEYMDLADLCLSYEAAGCKWDDGKEKCSGNAKFD